MEFQLYRRSGTVVENRSLRLLPSPDVKPIGSLRLPQVPSPVVMAPETIYRLPSKLYMMPEFSYCLSSHSIGTGNGGGNESRNNDSSEDEALQ